MPFIDEWLVATVRTLLPDADVEALRPEGDQTASLWDTLVSRRLASDDDISAAVATRFRLPLADFGLLDPRVRDAVPENLIRRFQVLPLRITDSHLEIATANPFDIDAEKMLAFSTGREVRVYLASPAAIRVRLEQLYQMKVEPMEVSTQSTLLTNLDSELVEVTQLSDEPVEDLSGSADEASKGPIIRLVDMMLADGIASRASDVHIEPVEGGVVVRYRIDGVLRQVMKIQRSAGIPLISRIKIMSGLDIADRRRPQDGRARMAVNGAPVDLRVSTLPAAHGEKVVIRILNQKSTVLSLDKLGLYPEERARIEELLGNKEGIILVTGPTGSGKTTTLYSCLRRIQSEGVNIVTVEDPVEFKLGENIVQVQVHEKAGLTFAAALRSILRQDPDVVLVGEIRDLETAETAIQASLTGHLVLSTLHTNDAATAVTRLVDMGIEAYKLSSALRGVVAQRLLRKLCGVCKQRATGAIPARLKKYVPEGAKLYEAVGCAECATTGYRGRFSIVEVLTMTPELKRIVTGNGNASQLADGARRLNMGSLFDSGLRHVLDGETTIEELLRVTDIPMEDADIAAADAAGDLSLAPRGAAAAVPVVAAPPVAVSAPPAPAPTRPATNTFDIGMSFDLVEELGADLIPDGLQPARGRTILLVEDEDQLRRVMKDLLEREGYRVAEARDGVEALDAVDRHAPDLIMLDLNLPGLDGYGVLQQLRSRPSTANIPVIVLTAKGDEDNEVRVFELGADDFLTKPFRARALSARLDAVLNRRRA
jgi:type II secretory ATPase GspE/PulE/Tfp pilus assembly ATPase PilB-like protein